MSQSRESILKNFGQYVKKIRIDKKMTQIDVSTAMNRDQQSLQRLESGRVNPSLLYLIDLANALQVRLEELTTFDQFK